MCSIETPPEQVCDEHTIRLDPDEFDRLQAMMDEAPRDLPKLRRFLGTDPFPVE